MLATSDVLAHLLARGLITARDFLDDEVRVFEVARRNVNFRVSRTTGPGWFVKQGDGPGAFSGVHREASVYRLLGRPVRVGATQFRALPTFLDYDDDRDVLVTTYLSGATDLRALAATQPHRLTPAAAALGEVLARLHRSVPVADARAAIGDGEPGVLAAQRPGLALLRDFSAAGIDLVRLMQADADLMASLAQLASAWRSDALIHHDLRLENVLHRADTGRVAIVDWETAAVGDRAWDLGCVVGDLLGLWLLSIPGSPTMGPDACLHLARRPLAQVQTAITALVEGYVRADGLQDAADDDLCGRIAAYAGLKLLQAALEQVQNAPRWTMPALCHLQVGANLMRRPEDGRTVLLGLASAA